MTIPRRSLALAAAGLLALVSAACGDDSGDTGTVESSTTASAPATEVTLTAQLSGKEEVPGPGVTDGIGRAEVRIKAGELCYKLNATMGEMPMGAHIHTGAAGASGPVVLNLKPVFTKGESAFEAFESCIKPDAAVLANIEENPAGFYVNVHTAEHPDGAMRGQLSKAG